MINIRHLKGKFQLSYHLATQQGNLRVLKEERERESERPEGCLRLHIPINCRTLEPTHFPYCLTVKISTPFKP